MHKFFEMHKQFDRRLVGDSRDKDKSKEIGKNEPYRYQKATDLKPTNSYNNKNYTSNANQIPHKKKYSNIGEVVVEEEEDAMNEAESVDNDDDESDEYFGQNQMKLSLMLKTRQVQGIRFDLNQIMIYLISAFDGYGNRKRKDCPYPHPGR
jgi:hypothetical protein